MNLAATLAWIESTDSSTAIREGALLYPLLGGVHLLAIALFGGMLVVTDLKLLGWVMPRRRVSEVLEGLRTFKRGGFVVLAASGVLLAWGEPVRLARSPAFLVKLGLLALVGAHALAFRESVYGEPRRLDERLSGQARLAAVLSLILWSALVVSGRLIGFDS